jgi:signal peptidase I
VVLLLVALLLGWTFTHALAPVRVASDSMRPTLVAGDQVLVDKISPRAHHPRRRDIVTFHLPGSHQQLIKRVVAVAGDTVGLEDGVLVVDGAKLTERFVDHAQMDSVYFGPVRVPPGAVFVLGDDRADSVDSRSFGPVAVRDITGRVLLRIGFGHR